MNEVSSHSVSEFIYTLQRMGIMAKLPVIKGIEDFSKAAVSDCQLVIDSATNRVQNVSVLFNLPDFAVQPEIYIRQSQGNLFTSF